MIKNVGKFLTKKIDTQDFERYLQMAGQDFLFNFLSHQEFLPFLAWSL